MNKRGRPLKPPSSSDYCRICKANFKITLGNFSRYVSTENIYASKKSNAEGSSLSDLITKTLRIPVDKDENLSSRVCSKCALKIRNAAKLTNVVQSNINVPHADFSHIANASKDDGLHVNDVNVQFKRLHNSPGFARSPRKKRVKLNCSPTGKSNEASTSMNVINKQGFARTPRRSINFIPENENSNYDKENEDPVLPFAMNGEDISELSDNKTQKELEVDIHLNYPSGLRIVHINDTASKYLIKNVALKNWKAAVNIIFKHCDCKPSIHEATRSKVAAEFKEYSRSDNSILRYSSVAEMASFSNKLVQHEARLFCPLWSSAVDGALGVVKSDQKVSKASNVFALCTCSKIP